jgi:CelD/BcsL family acetyltransferase involved in cellulose biosynthesis
MTTVDRVARRMATAPTVRTEVVAPEHWDGVGDWDDAVAAMETPSVFLTRAWVQAWWRQIGLGRRRAALVRVADGVDRTLGLVPFTVERRGPAGRVRRLGLLGDALVGSEYLGPVARAGSEEVVVDAALRGLEEAGLGWDVVQLVGARPADPAATALHGAIIGGGGRADTREEPCAAVPLPADADRWLAGLGGSFRRRLRQRRRRLEHDHEVRYRLAASDAEIDRTLDRLFAMHQARWAARGRPGTFADPRVRAFYRDLAPAFLAAGRLRLWVLDVDGVSRAVQFGFAHHGVLHSLQEAYDSEWAEPGVSGLGVVLRFHAIEAAIAEGLRSYDFLGGDEDFKRRWGTSTGTVRETRVARPGLTGQAAWLTTFGRTDLRDSIAGRLPAPVKQRLRGLVTGR